MKTLADVVFCILAVLSLLIVAVSGEMQASNAGGGLTGESAGYLLLLFAALGYTQWFLRRVLSPLDRLTEEQQHLILGEAKKKGDYRVGTIALGYILAMLFAFPFILPLPPERDVPNFAYGAIFFIVVGVIGLSRSVVVVLTDKLSEKKENIEPNAPPNGGLATPPGSSSVTGGPPSVS